MNTSDYKSYLEVQKLIDDLGKEDGLLSGVILHGLDLSTALADKLRAFMIMEPVAFHDMVLLVRCPKTTTVSQKSLDIIVAWRFGSIQYSTTSILYTVKIAGPVKTFIRQSVRGRGLALAIV